MADDKLKPCPFCGGKKLVRSVDGGILPSYLGIERMREILDKTPYVVSCMVECELCGARIEGYAASNNLGENLAYRAVDDCYRKWNRRAENADRHD